MIYEIQEQACTEVYASDAGFVCIKQPNYEGGQMILMHPDRVQELVDALLRCVDEARECRKTWVSQDHGDEGGEDA